MPPLKITPIAYRPSKLSIPCSPFSPRLPITPPPPPPKPLDGITRAWAPHTTTPPPYPLQWLWQCHVCKLKYPLGATRRCLEDGHHFCAGTSIVRSRKAGKKTIKRHAACASEFDYQGWKSWGDWRRAEHELQRALTETAESVLGTLAGEKKDCWNRCDYPSECRWGQKLAFQNPVALQPTEKAAENALPEPPAEPATNFDDILQKMEGGGPSESRRTPAPPRDDFWSVVLTSATKRRNRKSPLRLNAIAEQDERETSPTRASIDLGAKSDISPPLPSLQMPTVKVDSLLDLDDLMDVDELDSVLLEMRRRR